MKLYLNVAASIAVLMLLLVASPLSSSPAESIFPKYNEYKLPAAQSITLPSGYFVPLEIYSASHSTWLAYQVRSNLSVSTALMNTNQFNLFNTSNTDDISNSIAYQNGTDAQGDLLVSFGAYFLVFYNYAPSGTANITFTYLTYPFTPFVAGPLTPPEPTGLASFGLYNVSGNAVPYSINTSTIVGAANITSIEAYNASAPTLNDTVSGATLQLNAVLIAQGRGSGSQEQQVYWAQNTPDFVTSASQISFNDNLWNNTNLGGFLSNRTVTSPNGNSVYPTYANESEAQYFYAYGTANYTYREPFDVKLLLNESVLSGKGVLLQMGEQVLENGSAITSTPVYWFDNITISDPGVQAAYFHIDGNDSTPVGSFEDAELVFGGEGNLEATNFTRMSATLGLYYLNASSAKLSPFPSYFSFGGDTGEAADDLHVNYIGNGSAEVVTGTPNYVYLGTASKATATASFSTTSSSVTATSSSTSSTATTTSSSSVYSSTPLSSSSSSSPGAAGISTSYWLVLVLALVVVILIVGFTSTRREKSETYRLPPDENSGY